MISWERIIVRCYCHLRLVLCLCFLHGQLETLFGFRFNPTYRDPMIIGQDSDSRRNDIRPSRLRRESRRGLITRSGPSCSKRRAIIVSANWRIARN